MSKFVKYLSATIVAGFVVYISWGIASYICSDLTRHTSNHISSELDNIQKTHGKLPKDLEKSEPDIEKLKSDKLVSKSTATGVVTKKDYTPTKEIRTPRNVMESTMSITPIGIIPTLESKTEYDTSYREEECKLSIECKENGKSFTLTNELTTYNVGDSVPLVVLTYESDRVVLDIDRK